MNYRELLKKHRSAVMGLMALLIILHHADWYTGFSIYDSIVNQFGSIGVRQSPQADKDLDHAERPGGEERKHLRLSEGLSHQHHTQHRRHRCHINC